MGDTGACLFTKGNEPGQRREEVKEGNEICSTGEGLVSVVPEIHLELGGSGRGFQIIQVYLVI